MREKTKPNPLIANCGFLIADSSAKADWVQRSMKKQSQTAESRKKNVPNEPNLMEAATGGNRLGGPGNADSGPIGDLD
jgi:hypothetical protein